MHNNEQTIKYYDHGDKYKRVFCRTPFEYLHVYREFVTLCCPQYTQDISSGNMGVESISEIWNSPTSRNIRNSVINGSYCFCDMDLCTGHDFVDIDKLDECYKEIYDTNTTIISWGPQKLNIGVDPSCNLNCKMCRSDHVDIHNDETVQIIYNKLREYDWSDLRYLTLNGAGEVFFGENDMLLLDAINKKDFPKLETIAIQTNLVLLNEKKWDRISHLAKEYRIEFYVSIDASTEETYNKIRRGGSFGAVMNNLSFLSEKKREGLVDYLELRFCVQNDNWREMKDFVRIGNEVGVDRIWFQILRGGKPGENICDPSHEEYEDFLDFVEDPIFESDSIDMNQINAVK